MNHLVPPPALDLIERLLVTDPTKRLTMNQVLSHAFLRGNVALRPVVGRKRMIVRKWFTTLRRRLLQMFRSMYGEVLHGTQSTTSVYTATTLR